MLKQRKRRYPEGDYGHKRWPRERPVWPTMIKGMMERRFRCEVTYFDNYEKFLNA